MLCVAVEVTHLRHFRALFFDDIPLEILLQYYDQWSDMHGSGLKQNPKCAVSVYNVRN